MLRFIVAVSIASSLTILSVSPRAQTRPRLADYYAEIPMTTLDAGWAPTFKAGLTSTPDLDGDGNQDLIVLGAAYPINGNQDRTPQPGRVFLGNGNGQFTPAPRALYPVDTLLTVLPGHTMFDDFNGDGRPDMFIATSGWDLIGEHDEQNLLFLSQPEGGWRDATATLPQILDFTHAAATGDISGRGVVDIFVGNGHPGKSRTTPYTLLNTGTGTFLKATSNVPAGPNQLLDPLTAHRFVSATLADLNADGLPELIIGTHKSNTNQKLRRSVVLWNRSGVFSETDITELPAAAVFEEFHEDYDIEPLDVDLDGLIDLVLVGEQPTYSGWFVQVIMNKGSRRFLDETAIRMAPIDSTRGDLGVPNNLPYPAKVEVVDFNQDGWPDFAPEWQSQGANFTQDLPLVWINDGSGHFVTLKVRDFLAPGREAALGRRTHLMTTRNGYTFIAPIYDTATRTGGLKLTGVLAAKPYRLVPTP